MLRRKMLKRNNSYQQQPPRYQGLRARNVLQFMSALIVPLMLGVFTIVTTFHQQKMAREQRLEDLNESRYQRLEDLNETRNQRLEDLNETRNQRLEDLNETRNQRLLGEGLQRELATKRYQDDLLVAYINAMAKLLEKYMGSLISNNVASTIARVKTLTTFRQLDAQHNFQIIRFLYEAKQLTDTPENRSLDLSAAELFDIDFRNASIKKKLLHNLSLTDVFLMNATFIGLQMEHIGFAGTEFDIANFSLGRINHSNFSFTIFQNANFSCTILSNTIFANAELKHINFSYTQLDNVDFSLAKLDILNYSSANILNVVFKSGSVQNINFLFAQLVHVSFSFARLENVDFSYALLNNVDFSFASLTNVNFSHTQLFNVKFSYTHAKNVDFSYALLNHVDFLNAILSNVNLSHTQLFNAKFSYTNFNYADFSFAELVKADFSNAELMNVNFSSAVLMLASFHFAKVSNTSFRQSSCVASRFDDASLSDCNFWRSNLKHAVFYEATFNQVNFSRANLYKANFTGTTIAKSELKDALSIQDATLSYETIVHDENLINDGQADCNISLITGWTLNCGSVMKVMSDKSNSNCQFTLQSLSTGAAMYQRINLSDKWDSSSWPYSQAVLTAEMSVGVSVELKGIKNNHSVFSEEILNSTKEKISLLLNEDMWELEVLIKFNAPANHRNINNYWCDDIKLYIIYGTYLELTRVIPNIPANATWAQNGVTVAGGKGQGNGKNQLNNPNGLFVDDDRTVVIADTWNHRIVQWMKGDTMNGQIVAGGNDYEDGLSQSTNPTLVLNPVDNLTLVLNQSTNPTLVLNPVDNLTLVLNQSTNPTLVLNIPIDIAFKLHQLIEPVDILIEKETNSLIICDEKRVVRWFRHTNTGKGEILIENVKCYGLAMDDQKYLYVSDTEKHEVRRYKLKENNGTLVAGGNGNGGSLHQLHKPSYLFVDRQQNVYISDSQNHRVMKWQKGAKEGLVVAGGNGSGNALTQLNNPQGLFVDTLGTIYVADSSNHRVMRWPQGAKHGTVLVGGNGQEAGANQFYYLRGLSVDRKGTLFSIQCNHRKSVSPSAIENSPIAIFPNFIGVNNRNIYTHDSLQFDDYVYLGSGIATMNQEALYDGHPRFVAVDQRMLKNVTHAFLIIQLDISFGDSNVSTPFQLNDFNELIWHRFLPTIILLYLFVDKSSFNN
ncbi:unnamed protein product [Rotaria socialis]|uniref:Uncharacterized protein n=1 Tax=Rotaria socialis TaxID=392032 RepID=A0A821D4A0_9BILA|nr:unnamed protein product [Rotaria socialis]